MSQGTALPIRLHVSPAKIQISSLIIVFALCYMEDPSHVASEDSNQTAG